MPVEKTLVIPNAKGLHARAAAEACPVSAIELS